MYTHLEDGSEQLGIQTREVFDTSIKVPMGFETQVDAELTYTISIENMEGNNISNYTIYLVDNYKNTIYDLNNVGYTFKSGKGTFDGRFTLLFEDLILGDSEFGLRDISLYPNPTRESVTIIAPNITIEWIEIYDLVGRKVSNVYSFDSSANTVDLSALSSATYLLKIKTSNGLTTKRVIKE